jgi:hypothetical protein
MAHAIEHALLLEVFVEESIAADGLDPSPIIPAGVTRVSGPPVPDRLLILLGVCPRHQPSV